MYVSRPMGFRLSFIALALCGIVATLSRRDVHLLVEAAESDVAVKMNNDEHGLQSSDSEHPILQSHQLQRRKLRATGEKGRDLQTVVTKKSLAQAIAHGLRVPLAAKRKQKPAPSSHQVQGMNIAPKNAKTKSRAGSQGEKTRGMSNNNKKKNMNNSKKNRNDNKKQQSPNKKRSNNQNKKRNSSVSARNKKRKRNVKKTRSGSRNYKQSSNNKKVLRSGSNKNRQSGKNMKQRTSSTSSFLHGINQALGGNRESSGSNGGYGSTGKPVKYLKPMSGWGGSTPAMKYTNPVSGWGGSTHEPPIIWDGGTHTSAGVSGVLMPCACQEEPTFWGSSSSGGKSGKASSVKEHNCLCLMSGLLPDDLPTTFMPTYFPVS